MVVTSVLRRTLVSIPSPLKRAIKFVLPKREKAPKKEQETLLQQVDMLAYAILNPLWK